MLPGRNSDSETESLRSRRGELEVLSWRVSWRLVRPRMVSVRLGELGEKLFVVAFLRDVTRCSNPPPCL